MAMDPLRIAALAALALACAIVALTNWQLRALQPSFLAPQFTYSRQAFDAIVSRWSAAQLAAYRRLLRADFVTLGCYAAFGWLWVGGSVQREPGLLAWVLPAAALCDAVENALHLRFTRPVAPASADGWHLAAGFASALKFALIGAFAGAAVLGA